MSRLFVFPVRYPFTKIVECFLNDEMPYLANEFDEVVFVPLKKEVPEAIHLPDNCSFKKPIINNLFTLIFRGLLCRRSFKILWKDFLEYEVWRNYKRFKVWLVGYFTVNTILNSPTIKSIEIELKPEDVCYFYWGKWSNILSYFWKDKAKFISRFHGWGDLWESDYDDYFPLRKYVVKSLYCAVHISTAGEKYFKKKYPECSTAIHRLGSFNKGVCHQSKSSVIEIVSCSSLWPLKRVNLIMASSASMALRFRQKVHWTHIGGTSKELFNLRSETEKHANEYFSYNLVGAIRHEEVLNYYSHHHYDIFINLSSIEGVPVSIMEAISFDIPTLATDVGGTSDVVVDGKSGVLVSSNPTEEEVVNAISNIYDNRSHFHPHDFWDENFNADKNYSKFARFLKSI